MARCAPSSWKPYSPWSNDLLIRTGVQPFEPWHSEHSARSEPWGLAIGDVASADKGAAASQTSPMIAISTIEAAGV